MSHHKYLLLLQDANKILGRNTLSKKKNSTNLTHQIIKDEQIKIISINARGIAQKKKSIDSWRLTVEKKKQLSSPIKVK